MSGRVRFRDSVAIGGATARSYTLTAADAGARIALHVQGTKAGYATIIRTSGPTVPIARWAEPARPPARVATFRRS